MPAHVDYFLFQERRKEMAKLVSKLGEEGKIAIR
jgi:ribosome recycling factor